jgi:chromosome segregation ATPase
MIARMKRLAAMTPRLMALALLLQAAALSWAQSTDRFYRYEDAEGNTAIDDHVPPAFAHKGYAVLNRAGRVIEMVPRALTEAERNDPNSAAVRSRLLAEEVERQKRSDQALLIRYSSVADIEDHMRRKLNEVKVRTNSEKSNMDSLIQQLAARQAEAAEYERSGREVPPELLRVQEEIRAVIAEQETRITALEQEQNTLEARYQYDIERFRVIRPGAP